MRLTSWEIYTPPQGPPQIDGPSREIYELMGEENIYRMLEDFYRQLENSPIRHLFPQDMAAASRKIAMYFIFLFGGPPLFQQHFGPPRLRARHLRFPIDGQARVVWLDCFEKILQNAETKYNFPSQHLDGFRTFLREFSGWMVNKESSN